MNLDVSVTPNTHSALFGASSTSLQSQSPAKAVTPSDTEELDPTQYLESRLAMLSDARAKGIDVYPHKWVVSKSIPEFVQQFETLKEGEHREDVEVTIAGRLMRVAGSGQALRFYDIVGEGSKIQIMAKKE